MGLSPDGRDAAFDVSRSAGSESPQFDVFIADAVTGTVNPLIEHPAQDAYPVWLPDGAGVLFASDRGGALGLWCQKVADGRPLGDPWLVRPNMGRFHPLGFGPRDTFYYTLESQVDVYTAAVDLRGGRVSSAHPVPAAYMGMNEYPEWSPDGSRLLFVSTRGEIIGTGTIGFDVYDFGSATERFFAPEATRPIGPPRWSPDGSSIVFPGIGPGGRGIYVMNLANAEARLLPVNRIRGPSPSWSKDGRSVLYIDRGSSVWAIGAVDLGTGSSRVLFQMPNVFAYLPSPHDRWIGWTTIRRNELDTAPLRVNLTSMRDGSTITLSAEHRITSELLGWSPDDDHLIVSRSQLAPDGTRRDAEIVVFNTGGGPPRSVGWLHGDLPRSIRLSPTRDRVAFESGSPFTLTTWTMRGF